MNWDITNILAKFANSFDLKEWDTLKNLLVDNIECDYQDLRDQSGVFSKEEYVNSRKDALEHLQTQHLYSNVEINATDSHATCRVSAMIYRSSNNGAYFNSHVIYNFELIKLKNNEWRFRKIKQIVLWHDGDASIHRGVATSE